MSELKIIANNEETAVTKTADKTRRFLNHSLFDWLTLLSSLFVPLIVGILTVILPLQQQNLSNLQNENSQTIASSNHLQDIKLLSDQQKQNILNAFEHDLCNLLLQYNSLYTYENLTDNHHNDDSDDDQRISLVIRTKTLHALRQLDPARKILLIQLLIDSGVQYRINISQADLSSLTFPPGSFYNQLQFVNVIARNITLNRIYLYQSDFSYSILDDSSFYESNCSYVDFSYTSLQRTDWTKTDITQALFNFSNLLGAKITSQQLATAQSLQGATLPNGSIVAI